MTFISLLGFDYSMDFLAHDSYFELHKFLDIHSCVPWYIVTVNDAISALGFYSF